MFISIIKLLLALILCLYLMLAKKLTLSGTFFCILDIIILYFMGSPIWLNIFLITSILSIFIPKVFNKSTKAEKAPRNWKDMMALTIGSVICITINRFQLHENLAFASFCSALAFIIADIFSSEIRLSIWNSKARLISQGFKVVDHGVSGAVSLSGFFFSLVGSSILGIFFYCNYLNIYISLLITLVGFFVCFLESAFNDYKQVYKLNVNNELTNIIFVLISMALTSLAII